MSTIPRKGFAILIKAPGAKRCFVPREGETITITDKDGKELWSFKNPQGQANPGVIILGFAGHHMTNRCQRCQKNVSRDPA